MGRALEMSKQSMATTEAKDRDGWLGLFADDAVVEDPVGPSFVDPEDGKGQRGIGGHHRLLRQRHLPERGDRSSPSASPSSAATRCATSASSASPCPATRWRSCQLANIYKVNAEGKLASLRSFWEQDKLEFNPG